MFKGIYTSNVHFKQEFTQFFFHFLSDFFYHDFILGFFLTHDVMPILTI